MSRYHRHHDDVYAPPRTDCSAAGAAVERSDSAVRALSTVAGSAHQNVPSSYTLSAASNICALRSALQVHKWCCLIHYLISLWEIFIVLMWIWCGMIHWLFSKDVDPQIWWIQYNFWLEFLRIQGQVSCWSWCNHLVDFWFWNTSLELSPSLFQWCFTTMVLVRVFFWRSGLFKH
jgi:hypothetical protein